MTPDEQRETAAQIPLDELIAFLGELTAAFEEHPDEQTRQAALNLLQGLDALHRAAFTRLTAYLNERHAGHLLVEAAESDRLIGTVLNLYDLLPSEVNVRQAEEALARVRPYVESHGGKLMVEDVREGVVYITMGGACQGCAGATYTLQRGVRQALAEGLPGFEQVVVQEPQARPAGREGGLIGLEQIYVPPALVQGPDFQPVLPLAELPAGHMKQVTVQELQLLLINVADEIFAVGAMCPGSMLPLVTGHLDGEKLVCGWHNERFDLVSGICLDPASTRQQERLPVYPVAIQHDSIQVAVNVPARPPVVARTHD